MVQVESKPLVPITGFHGFYRVPGVAAGIFDRNTDCAIQEFDIFHSDTQGSDVAKVASVKRSKRR